MFFSIKRGLGTAAAQCITKILGLASDGLLQSNLLNDLLTEILGYSSPKDIFNVLKTILFSSCPPIRENIMKKILELSPRPMNQMLVMIVTNEVDVSILSSLLASGDEFIALEAFSILTKDTLNQRRKPTSQINSNDLTLFQQFIEDVLFSGSVDFRQKVTVSAKSFYDQIFARIYHLIRDLSKKPREKPLIGGEGVNSVDLMDREALESELEMLFSWLGQFVKNSLVEPFDFCVSNFGSVDFSFSQILAILSAFEGNVTLVAANPLIMTSIFGKFKAAVIEFSLLPFADKFINCVGKSTYDSIRIQAIDIICRCNVDASKVSLESFSKGLTHPRAINNEGAARIVLLYSRLVKESRIESILKELETSFEHLKTDFPLSLRANNINGRLLLLRLLIQEKPIIDSAAFERIIGLSVEVSNFVSSITSDPSPEGLNVMSNEDDFDLEDSENENETENESDETISSQYVLSFSWRAIKETSSLVERLLKNYPAMASRNHFKIIVEHFKSLLLKLRHCGAFRAIQAPLSTTLRLGYTFSEKKQFLMDSLDVCLGLDQISITRRSAGLPFLVLASIHSCSGRTDESKQLLSTLIPTLISTASDNCRNDHMSPSYSIIHAFNIIRSLVRDSHIASEMGTHMASIADLCLRSFNSDHWNIRNTSSMLLSSLISRIFGPRHVNNISSSDHQVDLREIDVKFEGLVKVLADFLKFDSLDFEPRIAYPLLAVLERIKIPPHERFDDFRSSIISFLSKLLENLESHPESGRKLSHVLGRTVYSLLNSKSLSIVAVHNEILLKAPKGTPNSIYNFLVLVEHVQFCDSVSNFDFSDLFLSLPPDSNDWHQILLLKYNQVKSHKSSFDSKLLLQIKSPVLR